MKFVVFEENQTGCTKDWKKRYTLFRQRCLKLSQKVNTIRKTTTYFMNSASFFVLQAIDIGIVSEVEANKTFHGIIRNGIADKEPIWRFYFMRICNSLDGGTCSIVQFLSNPLQFNA